MYKRVTLIINCAKLIMNGIEGEKKSSFTIHTIGALVMLNRAKHKER